MQYVELYPGIRSSVLGFGCAQILGSVDGSSARRAVAIALEEGITHFDVARCYGFGEAECLLGECVRKRRHEVVIASKFGITATSTALLLRPLKPLVRLAKQQWRASKKTDNIARPSAPSLRSFSNNILLKRVPLQPSALVRSVEKSLSELKTDYLDYLLLHEPLEMRILDDICAVSNQLKQAGKIRAFGLALVQEQIDCHSNYLSRFDVLQMDNSPLALNYCNLVAQRKELPTIFFSPFRSSIALLESSRSTPSQILHRMHIDFPRSVILVSMFRETHIRQNARAI